MGRFTFDLTGRTAVVTGAGRGVGRGIARALAAHGARVAVNDFVLEHAVAVAAEIEADGGTAIAAAADVADMAAVRAMAGVVERRLGGVDILVNNAGNAGPDAPMPRLDFWLTDPTDWDRYLRVNLLGVMHCARAFTAGMVARRRGRVITIVSDAGRTGEAGYEAYSAAKAGAAGFSRALARALGRHGVTANTISLSSMARALADPSPQAAAQVQAILKHYVIRRQGRPDDVAAVAVLLASDESGWITGQNYPVNGGFSFAL